ncbi:hypothetical protein [Helicobacter hepaticus]|jgi:hypothetical protein|uniref:Uncharacterized protein n=1 Tax=Helicobacter hepaticus (strain ATCC 51449 / 3B1) TaxID=235279 RepID=Q7VFE4_HELHP|nr:hypothetical protein [Helicobacter hepaticus]AAP78330.1 hypothetical protein HH_1733 [Helicobacter hepaticus ATCC 51449]
MQFNTIDTLVRKFYVLKEKGFVANPNYKEDLQHMLPQEEFAMFNIMFEQEALNKAIDNIKRSYTAGFAKKQCVINILSEPKITQIASVLLKGSQANTLEKAIRLREQTDKASIIFLELMRSIEDKLLTFLTSRINNFPSNTSPDNFTQTLARKEISLSNAARYFGGDFEKAYLDDKGAGKTYFDFLTCQVLAKHKFMHTEDVQRLLLVFIWNSIPAFLSKTRFTSVGSVH